MDASNLPPTYYAAFGAIVGALITVFIGHPVMNLLHKRRWRLELKYDLYKRANVYMTQQLLKAAGDQVPITKDGVEI